MSGSYMFSGVCCSGVSQRVSSANEMCGFGLGSGSGSGSSANEMCGWAVECFSQDRKEITWMDLDDVREVKGGR